MEQLAKTCKILYDKDYIENKKKIDQNNFYKKVFYNDINEYKNLCDDFIEELPIIIKENNIDEWSFNNYNYNIFYRLQYSCNCETILKKILYKLTKNQNNMWVVRTAQLIDNAIRGLAESISKMSILFNYGYNVSEIQTNFQSKELCNIMITNMIKQIVIGDSCEYTDGYELAYIREFLCKKCNKKVNYINDNNICVNCV